MKLIIKRAALSHELNDEVAILCRVFEINLTVMAPSYKVKRGRKSIISSSKLPRYAGMKAQIQEKRNQNKSRHTMKVYRYGFKLMERVCKALMKRNKIKLFGKYRKNNAHGGRIWGNPRECNMTNRLARDIMFKCIQSKELTYDQLRAVRKSLAYSKELSGGVQGENWKDVAVAWDTMRREELPAKMKVLVPNKIPRPIDLKTAWNKGYNNEIPLAKFTTGNICAYDTFILGSRPNVKLRRNRL